MRLEKISVIGLGYIGLPTAAVLASRGIDVIGVDISEEAIDAINEGRIHIVEPDLDIVVRSVVQMGKLKATMTAEKADAFLIAVPTPFKDGKEPDLSYIRAAAETIAPVLDKGNLVVLESTSPVGTTEKLAEWLCDLRPDLNFPHAKKSNSDVNIAYCPERVLPGHVLQELVSNDRLIGGITSVCSEKAKDLYSIFVSGKCFITNSRTAEMAKLTENSFRDVNIAFANELSMICDKMKISVWELIELANLHPRVNILQPGPGVGGHCIAVDPWFIVSSAPEEANLIKTARHVNDAKPDFVLNQICKAAGQFKTPIIACLGITYKANIDDLRESPAMNITMQLATEKAYRVLLVEPNIESLNPQLLGLGIELTSLDEALELANTIVILVDHDEFKSINKETLYSKLLIDTRGLIR